jgi:hypothetical protein
MDRRRLLTLTTLALAGALLFPSMAAPLNGNGDQIDETAIVLEPYAGPNGAYVDMEDRDGDGDLELGLDFSSSNPAMDGDGDGVDANSLIPVHQVFTITNTGEEVANVYLTDNNGDITFYRNVDRRDSLEGGKNSVMLGPDQKIAVGVLLDTRNGDAVEEIETFTVHAESVGKEMETEENGGDGDNDGGDSGGDSDDGGNEGGGIGIQSTPTDTPRDEGTETDTDTETETNTDGSNDTTGESETDGTTTTMTPEQTGTTLSPAETAAERQQDPGTSGDAGVTLGGLPWWLVLLALLVAAAIGGYGYRRLGT